MLRQTLATTASLALISLLLTGCALNDFDQENLPAWTTTLELPLLEASVNLRTLLDDSLITTQPLPEGDSIYVYQDTLQIDELQVGDELHLEPMSSDFTQHPCDFQISLSDSFCVHYDTVSLADVAETINAEVGPIELDNIEPQTSAPYPFRDVMPGSLVAYLEQMLADSGGTAQVAVDAVELYPLTRRIEFVTFRQATLSSGLLRITIINEMFVYLGVPLLVTVQDTLGNELFALPWNEEIPPGGTGSQVADLTGYTVPGTVDVRVSGFSNGTHGLPVEITDADLDAGFLVRMTAENFAAESAQAQIPSQTIAGAAAIQLEDSETRIEEGVLARGDLRIDMFNEMGLTGTVLLNIPSLESPLGVPYQAEFPLPPATGQFQDDLSGWTLRMELAEQTIDYDYIIITDDTAPEFIELHSSDQAILELEINNIACSEMSGTIAQQVLEDFDQMELESEMQIQSAVIEEGAIQLRVDNQVGGQASVAFTVPELRRDGVPVDSTIVVGTGASLHLWDLAGCVLTPPSLEEQIISCHTVTTTDTTYGYYQLTDSIRVAASLPSLLFSEVTGIFTEASIVENDSVETGSEHTVEQAEIQSGVVTLDLVNRIGMPLELEFQLADLTLAGEPLTRLYEIPPDGQIHTRQLDLAGYRLSLPPDRQQVCYQSSLRLPTDDLITLFRSDSLIGELRFDTLRFASLTGTVDSLVVESDTTSESLEVLPEELSGIHFENADMVIDLETDIGGDDTDSLSVMLTIGMLASNSDGEEILTTIENWSVLDSNRVQVPNAEDLLNIFPDRIETWGSAVVNGHATVEHTQFIRGNLEILLPFEFEITQDAVIDLDHELVDESLPDEIAEVSLRMGLNNQFEFGSRITVLAALDTTAFSSGGADTLLQLELPANTSRLDTINLTPAKIELFAAESTWISGKVEILSQLDDEGNPLVTRILASDSLNLDLSGRFRLRIDPEDM